MHHVDAGHGKVPLQTYVISDRSPRRSSTIKRLHDFTLTLGGKPYIPLIIGGMGVDISTPALAWEIARLGGIAHISDAMMPVLADRTFGTRYEQQKRSRYGDRSVEDDKKGITFDLGELAQATRRYVQRVMEGKRGPGAIFLNVMEKLTMGSPRESLRSRITAALDAGIEGVTLAAGLHLGTFDLIKDHPRFREAQMGIVVSSVRALSVFLRRALKLERQPDYIIVEGPLAGGHLGFPVEWQQFSLTHIVQEVLDHLAEQRLRIPVIAAGGIFSGPEAVKFMEMGAAGVQVATRFAVTRESGLPEAVKQQFFLANEDDVVVNTISATGYPMRMLRQSPAINSSGRPNCEAFGYLLDSDGSCPYLTAYNREAKKGETPVRVTEKMCLCAQMKGHRVWTCGHNVSRLKDTVHRNADGSYPLPTAEEVFNDYAYSVDEAVTLPSCAVQCGVA